MNARANGPLNKKGENMKVIKVNGNIKLEAYDSGYKGTEYYIVDYRTKTHSFVFYDLDKALHSFKNYE